MADPYDSLATDVTAFIGSRSVIDASELEKLFVKNGVSVMKTSSICDALGSVDAKLKEKETPPCQP